ncbi:MAG: Gfo/Idh/MocA family oxidoreductase [Sphingomicrobium sp.]
MTRIAIAGVGKIARDQHIPHILANPDFDYVAAVTRGAIDGDGVPAFHSIPEMMAANLGVEAIAICTPPISRMPLLADALAAKLDVLMEKPPAATLSEAEHFSVMAQEAGGLLYQSWHSREAAAVEPAREWLKGKAIKSVRVDWLEDVRVWHPGQEWVWEPGIGVFDPGINALSVISRLLPRPLMVQTSELRFPSNKPAPIAATLALTNPAGIPIAVNLDWDQKGPQTWDISFETDGGMLKLGHGASLMWVDGTAVDVVAEPEYATMYKRFAELIKARESDIDLSPFRIVADAFLLARRSVVGAFTEAG